ncbi:MAG TPA: STAS domain-containing protein [Bryobacteraceae bacterium]|nr:STAS domain-containing protein [Bryobacteraceae bacterium]
MSAGPADAALPPNAPPFVLQTSLEDASAVIRCTGKLTAGHTGILRDEVKRLIPQSKKIVLDLTDLTLMDSLGLGTIVGLYVSAKASGSRLVLINLSPRVGDLFRITNVWSILEVYGENIMRMP